MAATSGCLSTALSSKVILQSSASTRLSAVTTSGLISTSDASSATKASYSLRRKGTAFLATSPRRPRAYARLRAWYGANPTAGSTCSSRMASGVLAATSSISMPPAAEAITTTRLFVRSTNTDAYSSRAMATPCSTSSRLTMRPSGPV